MKEMCVRNVRCARGAEGHGLATSDLWRHGRRRRRSYGWVASQLTAAAAATTTTGRRSNGNATIIFISRALRGTSDVWRAYHTFGGARACPTPVPCIRILTRFTSSSSIRLGSSEQRARHGDNTRHYRRMCVASRRIVFRCTIEKSISKQYNRTTINKKIDEFQLEFFFFIEKMTKNKTEITCTRRDFTERRILSLSPHAN